MVRDEILTPNPDAPLRVYVAWVPFLGGTQADIDVGTMPDERVMHFWDGNRITSQFFAREVFGGGGEAWDVYFLYGPDARWNEAPAPVIGSGGTVVGQIDTIREQIAPFLRPA